MSHPMMCFRRYRETWLQQLNVLLQELSSTPKPKTGEDQINLRQLVERVMTHYEDYYRVKAHTTSLDAFSMFSAPSWLTCLERSFHWIAGWRPIIAFLLIFIESSYRLKADLGDFLRGHRTGDLADLSPSQLEEMTNLHSETVNEEDEINKELLEWQDAGMCDVMLSINADVDGKLQRLEEVLEKADNLRLKTLRRLVDLLTPQQAIEFLTATAEMVLGIREWGLEKNLTRGEV
ncbi:hypothetical protein NE237_032454 [Protea cynaroides]|uniref:DOG1 domain-containing protein n=1 Tax=Protea cynaroides TaxID=273540 RepID=A0A9Q0L3C2_9MAGN|nr:hypothetical protein NE237_032454 [Protea cynaroides]